MLNASGVAAGSVTWRSYMTPTRTADVAAPSVEAVVTFSSPLGPRTFEFLNVSNSVGGTCDVPACTPVAPGGTIAAGQLITCTFNCSQGVTSVTPAVTVSSYTVTSAPVVVANVSVDGDTACVRLNAPSVTNHLVCGGWRLFWGVQGGVG